MSADEPKKESKPGAARTYSYKASIYLANYIDLAIDLLKSQGITTTRSQLQRVVMEHSASDPEKIVAIYKKEFGL